MKPFQSFHSKNIQKSKITMDSHAICKHFKLSNYKTFIIQKCVFLNSCPVLEHFGVYSDNVMYYLSTNPEANVVKHLLDEGKRIKVIEQCKIPNHHLKPQETLHLQG